jgi:hypothetical protein
VTRTIPAAKAPVVVTVSDASRKATLLAGRMTFTAKVTHPVTGAGLAGIPVTFRATSILGYTVSCTAVTSSAGVASCSNANGNVLLMATGAPITASAAATANTLAGTGTGKVTK